MATALCVGTLCPKLIKMGFWVEPMQHININRPCINLFNIHYVKLYSNESSIGTPCILSFYRLGTVSFPIFWTSPLGWASWKSVHTHARAQADSPNGYFDFLCEFCEINDNIHKRRWNALYHTHLGTEGQTFLYRKFDLHEWQNNNANLDGGGSSRVWIFIFTINENLNDINVVSSQKSLLHLQCDIMFFLVWFFAV